MVGTLASTTARNLAEVYNFVPNSNGVPLLAGWGRRRAC
jgi:hypothetical protein